MNQCTLARFSIKWKMAWSIQLIVSKIGMKQCCNMQIPIGKGVGNKCVSYICRIKRNNICCSQHLQLSIDKTILNVVGEALTILI